MTDFNVLISNKMEIKKTGSHITMVKCMQTVFTCVLLCTDALQPKRH
jgi:hypothetical protein